MGLLGVRGTVAAGRTPGGGESELQGLVRKSRAVRRRGCRYRKASRKCCWFPGLAVGARTQRVVEACEEVGLDAAHRHRVPQEFGAGQRQRIPLARALVLLPRLIVLDEPTCGAHPADGSRDRRTAPPPVRRGRTRAGFGAPGERVAQPERIERAHELIAVHAHRVGLTALPANVQVFKNDELRGSTQGRPARIEFTVGMLPGGHRPGSQCHSVPARHPPFRRGCGR